jgi:hypothetical protein
MITPGKYDITIYQGATFDLLIQYKDSTGTPVNMTGYEIGGTLWPHFPLHGQVRPVVYLGFA